MFVRVSALTTGLTAEDVKSVAVEGLGSIVLAKAETRSDVLELVVILEEIEKNRVLEFGNLRIIPLAETPKGVALAYEIASASERIVAVGFGARDYYMRPGTKCLLSLS